MKVIPTSIKTLVVLSVAVVSIQTVLETVRIRHARPNGGCPSSRRGNLPRTEVGGRSVEDTVFLRYLHTACTNACAINNSQAKDQSNGTRVEIKSKEAKTLIIEALYHKKGYPEPLETYLQAMQSTSWQLAGHRCWLFSWA